MIRTLLRDFLGSQAFKRHLRLAQARTEELSHLHDRVAGFLRGDESLDGFRATIADAVERHTVLQGDGGDGEALPIWGFGGPGTAQFLDVLCRTGDPARVEDELRHALAGIDLADPSERLRAFASFVAQVARAAGMGPESNLHVGYATCFLSFCWHVLYDLEVPVFYGSSHKGMKQLIAAGAVEDQDYGSRDLARRFSAFLRITRGLRDLLRRVNPRLGFWTVEAFLDWYAEQSDVSVEDSGSMMRPPSLGRADSMATMATIDPALVAAAVQLHDEELGRASGARPERTFPSGADGVGADAVTPAPAAWYEGRVQPAGPDYVPPTPPEPVLDPNELADVPLKPIGKASGSFARGGGSAPAPAQSPAQEALAIPGLTEVEPGGSLLDSTAGGRAPVPAAAPPAAPPLVRAPAHDTDDDLDHDRDDVEEDDYLEPALGSQAFVAAGGAGWAAAPAPPAPAAPAPRPAAPPPPPAAAAAVAAAARAPSAAPAASGATAAAPAAPAASGDLVRQLEAVTRQPAALLADVLALLERRGQVVLEGPTGSGKTFLARELARLFAGSPDRVRVVQLHPAYRYEELIEAPLPGAAPGPHGAAPGVFKAFAEAARRQPGERFALVIDDIGRGDVVRALGECFSLLEYRDAEVVLPFSRSSFSIPRNLYLIATAGTGPDDGGLGPALRRRFPCVPLRPDAEVLRRFLADEAPGMTWVADAFDALNKRIRAELGGRHEIGHAVLMRPGLDDAQLARIWAYDILPALEAVVGDAERLDGFRLDALRPAAAAG